MNTNPYLDTIVEAEDLLTSLHDAAKRLQTAIAAERITQIGRAQRLNSSHVKISYAVFCLKKKTAHA